MTPLLRYLLVVLTVAPFVWGAEGGAELSAVQETELIGAVGGTELWDGLPEWRRRTLRQRYLKFVAKSPDEQRQIRSRGLREYLIRPGKKHGLRRLPEPLRAEIRRLPEPVRAEAAKLVTMRLHQLRLDRHLSLIPFAERRPMFRRLFPEPFDPTQARIARKELERGVARSLAQRVRDRMAAEERERGAPLDQAQRRGRMRALVKEFTHAEEERVLARVHRELEKLASVDPKRARQLLEREGIPALERMQLYLTPRQGELIRYALRPQDCPLLPPDFLGSRPKDPLERRLWDRDFRALARLDLLCEAGLPTEMVLHLAGSGTPEDFFRAVRALRGGPEKRPPQPEKR